MNLSGSLIYETLNYYKINKSKLYVVHDDLDLEIAKLKIKIGGGNGGHNGLLSIDKIIGNNYFRIRIGIGHPGNKDLVSSYVLQKFPRSHNILINKKLDLIIKYFDLIFKDTSLFLNRITFEEKKDGI